MQTLYRILLSFGLSAGGAMCAHSQDEWPRFLGSKYDSTAAAPMERIESIDWAKPPIYQWSAKVGPGYGLGSVAGGRYYHFDATDDSENERLTARDVENGNTIWSVTSPMTYRDMFGYEEGSRSTPTIHGESIFTFGVDGRLSCRDIGDGKLVWSVDTGEKYGVIQNFFGVGSSPLIVDDMVIVMVGGSPVADQNIAPMQLNRVSPNGSAIVAFDQSDGSERWRTGEDLASYSSPRTVTIGDKPFVIAFARGGLMMIDPADGTVHWRFDHRADMLESVNAMMPVVDGDEVFISECYQVGSALLKINADSFEPVWIDPPGDRRRQAMRSHWATPILADGFLYGCSGRNSPDSDLRCIDWKTGGVQWSDPRRIRSSITRVGDHLIVLEERGRIEILRINPDKLDIVATWDLTQPDGDRPALTFPCWAAPIVVGDRVIVRGDENVVCLTFPTSQTAASR
ncbi:outer membrane biogenesis protein BamB [Rubripirellula tenax]|uniref:Outer membrane biogenesis protein BamB n=1 Tax=Rubripirellula tenax TaxID=2528015 RepID=A0A5C6FE89_9BACT|nr:PQQ-binding-like beta-propeller repeat protein [Rubripirellula tenax]TWU58416.1 outer membrane biogenesis protein BamB [Rubripirellula tenax]